MYYIHHAQDNRNDINDFIWFNTNQFFLYKNQFRLTNEQIWCWSSWNNVQKHAARNSTRLNLWCYFSPCKWTNKSASLKYFYLCFDLPNSISVAAHTWNWNFSLASWKRMIMFTLINFSHRLDIKKGCIHFDTIWYILRPQCCYFGHHSAGEVLTERAVKSFWLILDGKLHTDTDQIILKLNLVQLLKRVEQVTESKTFL